MVVLSQEPLLLEDERSKALLFALLASDPHGAFEFAEMLRLWYAGDKYCLAAFLEWLDAYGLEIRNKQ